MCRVYSVWRMSLWDLPARGARAHTTHSLCIMIYYFTTNCIYIFAVVVVVVVVVVVYLLIHQTNLCAHSQ